MDGKILVIDDESSMLAVIEAMLVNEDYEVKTFDKPLEGIEYYKQNGADIVISDIKMDLMNGINVLQQIKEINPDALVILITAYANAQDAFNALKIGAYDYIQKPFKMEKLRSVVKRALTVNKILFDSREENKKEESYVNFFSIITKNPVMTGLFDLVKKVSPSKTTILIQGESGTGKELFAKAIHMTSGREKEPFIAINCGALPENLLESELFGHVKGSFTGAVTDKDGLFTAAGNGTLFLDEISSLSFNLQSKLLRILQEKEMRPVGSVNTHPVLCRVIAATNVSLEEMIQKKTFREDLYYRLNIIPIEIPPLRERPDDLIILIKYFMKKMAPNKTLHFTPAAMNMLLEYNWPGNIRELENAIERITTICSEGEVKPEDLPTFIKKESAFTNLNTSGKVLSLKNFTAIAEGQYVLSVLQKFNNDKNRAAKELDVDIVTINRKLDRFDKLQNT
ncbi:MAG: Two component, sigma54 specific, transcriptional regulator, Fis family [uncultured bacterium]|nr:MAG: Two component, sigma54 specific, transcriptional regulator, Fis family [uncultured bacterium]